MGCLTTEDLKGDIGKHLTGNVTYSAGLWSTLEYGGQGFLGDSIRFKSHIG